ncbi:hypothetical protein VSDG_09544 [Cytospora chrysosperma]|uniref:Uncharacterized protein n=1 Tax=Cytospora chrysosperma TaxID=252740 RepID=A0A423VAG8_CYTCH|nr:hypothetical protein VSDG_09544 [Valsa sordida]
MTPVPVFLLDLVWYLHMWFIITTPRASSGIGLATAKLLLGKGATVHNIDQNEPDDEQEPDWVDWEEFHTHQADVTDWSAMLQIFESIKHIDYVFANAGVSDVGRNFLDDHFDHDGQLLEPLSIYKVLDVNLRAVLNTIKLAHHKMRKSKTQGSIVITGGSAGYWVDPLVRIGSVSWTAQLGIVRVLRHVLQKDDITINGVAPGATVSRMVPFRPVIAWMKHDLPLSKAEDVALALVYSATARQARRVETYGDEPDTALMVEGRWNGRVIQVLGEKFREIEQPLVDSRAVWLGEEFERLTKIQQSATDVTSRKARIRVDSSDESISTGDDNSEI